MSRQSYNSDITDEELNILKQHLEKRHDRGWANLALSIPEKSSMQFSI
jgi:hypothetical protein